MYRKKVPKCGTLKYSQQAAGLYFLKIEFCHFFNVPCGRIVLYFVQRRTYSLDVSKRFRAGHFKIQAGKNSNLKLIEKIR